MASSNPAADDVSIPIIDGAPSVVTTNVALQLANAVSIVPAMTFAKLFPNISQIEIFNDANFKKWQEDF